MPKNPPNLRLKYEREMHGWSQLEVAGMVGSTTVNVSRWERGITSPAPFLRRKLCELFDKDAVALGLLRVQESDTETTLPPPTDKQAVYDPAIPLSFMMTNDLVGRDTLLEQLKQQLSSHDNMASVALHGLPGVGKTALAITLVSDPKVREEFCDGILWAGLGTQPNVSGILSRWGTLFGVAASGMGSLKDNESWKGALREVIGPRRMLIVIDDVWEINNAMALIVGGPHCAYLMTTRFPHIAASFAAQKVISVPELSDEDGITLLQYLAPEITTDDAERVHTLVRSVGALPLALTLAGRYLHVQGYRGQVRRLRVAMERLLDAEQRLQLSISGVRSDAHPSLSAETPLSLQSVIAVSDQHLDEQARQALRALSVFPAKPNTFSEEAALAVSTISTEVLDTLSDAGLLEIDEAGRYTVHQAIADYAHSSLVDPDPSQRLVAYYQKYIEENRADFEALEQESQNIFTALEIAYTLEDHVALIQGVFTLVDFLLHRGLYDLGKTHLQHAYEATIARSDHHGTARALYYLGMIAQKQGEYLQATRLYEEGLASARQGEDGELICTLLSALGWVTEKRGNYAQAEAYVQEGLILVREINNTRLYGTLLRVLGTIADSQGNAHQAKACYQEALTIMRQYNDQEQCTILLINLGIIIANEGAFSESAALFEEALHIARQLSHLEWQCLALLNLGALMRILDENQRAYAYCEEGLKIARQIGHREWQSHLLNIQAFLTSKLQGPAEAEPVYREALALAREIGKPVLIAGLLGNLGQIALRRGNLDHAAELFSEMTKTIPEGSKPFQAEALYNQGLLAAARGESQKAHDLGISSIALFEEAHLQDESSKVQKWLTEGCQPLI
jgi:tetratricopeptide (TPR) repeat protein/transcriptional regulator with XRE-family HTH domain